MEHQVAPNTSLFSSRRPPVWFTSGWDCVFMVWGKCRAAPKSHITRLWLERAKRHVCVCCFVFLRRAFISAGPHTMCAWWKAPLRMRGWDHMLIHEGLLLRSPCSLETMQASHIHRGLVHTCAHTRMDKTEWHFLFILDVVLYSLNFQFSTGCYSRLFTVITTFHSMWRVHGVHLIVTNDRLRWSLIDVRC